MKITTPWTLEQTDSLNKYQVSGQFHPFTCGGNRGDKAHKEYAQNHKQDSGLLIATPEGWKCPVCSYTQNWAHSFMSGTE